MKKLFNIFALTLALIIFLAKSISVSAVTDPIGLKLLAKRYYEEFNELIELIIHDEPIEFVRCDLSEWRRAFVYTLEDIKIRESIQGVLIFLFSFINYSPCEKKYSLPNLLDLYVDCQILLNPDNESIVVLLKSKYGHTGQVVITSALENFLQNKSRIPLPEDFPLIYLPID